MQGIVWRAALAAAALVLGGGAQALVRSEAQVSSPGSASAALTDAQSAYATARAWSDGDASDASDIQPLCGAPNYPLWPPPPACEIVGDIDASAGAGAVGSLGWLGAYAEADDGGAASATARLTDMISFAPNGPARLDLLLDVDQLSMANGTGGSQVALEIYQDGAGPDGTDALLLGIYAWREETDDDSITGWEILAGGPFSAYPVPIDGGDQLRSRYRASLDLAQFVCGPQPTGPCLPQLPSMLLYVQLSTSARCDNFGCRAVADAAHSGYLGIGGDFTSASGYGYTAYAVAVPEAPSAALLGAGLVLLAGWTSRRRGGREPTPARPQR